MKELREFIQSNKKNFPSFFRLKELYRSIDNGMTPIYLEGQLVGFYILKNTQLKNFFITPQARGRGLFVRYLKELKNYTVCTTIRNCKTKHLFVKAGLTSTEQIVQGKQSLLQVWRKG